MTTWRISPVVRAQERVRSSIKVYNTRPDPRLTDPRLPFSSGIVEGLNNKAKVTTRNSYGFRTYRGAEIALYHALGKLPTPPMTHRFY